MSMHFHTPVLLQHFKKLLSATDEVNVTLAVVGADVTDDLIGLLSQFASKNYAL